MQQRRRRSGRLDPLERSERVGRSGRAHDHGRGLLVLAGYLGRALGRELDHRDELRAVEHSFTLDDDSVSEDVEPGESVTVTVDVTADAPFHCTYHPDQMTGTLTVA